MSDNERKSIYGDMTPAEIAAEWAELGVYEQEILMGTFPQRVEFVTEYYRSLIQKGYVNAITRIDHRFGQASLTEKGKALIDWLNDTPPAETQGDEFSADEETEAREEIIFEYESGHTSRAVQLYRELYPEYKHETDDYVERCVSDLVERAKHDNLSNVIQGLKAANAALTRELATARGELALEKTGFANAVKNYDDVCQAVMAWGSGDYVASEVDTLWRAIEMLTEGMVYKPDEGEILSSSGGWNSVQLWQGSDAHFLGNVILRSEIKRKRKAAGEVGDV